jgi:AGZA family xanthine/uracil permease-like MFS transporter
MVDGEGNLPQMEKPMLADALATVAGALMGTSTTGAYLESAAGIEEGGRTGLTAVTTAVLFLLALFLAPLFTMIPACAYGPALIVVGMVMITPLKMLKADDYSELIPAFTVITLMCFTFNLGMGIAAGFVVYPLFKVASGRLREVSSGSWVLFVLCLLFFLFYPSY